MLAGFGVLGFSLVSGPLVSRAVLYDNRVAMKIVRWDLEKTVLKPGEPLLPKFSTDKRPECAIPDGSGELEFRLYYDDARGVRRIVPLKSVVAMVKAHDLTPVVYEIELPVLSPGRYELQFRGTYWCANASPELTPQIIDSPRLAFEVVP